MTADEFQRKYHDYHTTDRDEAIREAMKLRIADNRVVAVQIGEEFTLMLETAARCVSSMGLVTILCPSQNSGANLP